MQRNLSFVVVALLACASQQRVPSEPAAPSTADTADRTTVVEPTRLDPEQVRLLQRSLVDRGFAVDLSGRFDQPTQDALAQFQRARGLPSTGNLNAPTIDALGLDPRDVQPERGGASTMGVGSGSTESTPSSGDTRRP